MSESYKKLQKVEVSLINHAILKVYEIYRIDRKK